MAYGTGLNQFIRSLEYESAIHQKYEHRTSLAGFPIEIVQ